MKALKLFYSYSHKDENLRDELEKHLSILKRQSIISSWHDRRIDAGTEWVNAIDSNLDSAQIILLLISSDFINSAYCYGKELKRAMERYERGEAKVIPVILRPVDWDGAPFSKLQALPKNGKAVTTWDNIDEAFTDIAKGIRSAVELLTTVSANSMCRDTSPNTQTRISLDLHRPITIRRIRKQEKIDAKFIANVAFHPAGHLMAYSLDNRLFVLPLNDAFPERLGMHKPTSSTTRGISCNEQASSSKELSEFAPIWREFISTVASEAHLHRITDISFSPDGKLVASSDNQGIIKFWALETRECVAELREHLDFITGISFSPQGELFASAGYDEFLNIWKVSDILSQQLTPIKIFTKKSKIKKRPRYQHDIEQIIAMTFSHSGKHIASGDQQGVVVVREIATDEEVYRKKVHNSYVTGIAFSPTNSALLATASDDKRIRLIDFLRGGKPVTLGVGLDKHTDSVNSIAFSYKGDVLVSSACDKLVNLWDVKNRRLLYTYRNEDERPVEKVAFFPNQYDFATNCYTSHISLWGITNEGDVTNTRIGFEY